MDSPENRRKTVRVAVSIPAGVYPKDRPHDVIDVEILSLSEGGAFVRSTRPMPVGQVVLIEMRFVETKLFEAKIVEMDVEIENAALTQSPAQSIVRWSTQDQQPGFGVEFVDLEPDRKKFLSK